MIIEVLPKVGASNFDPDVPWSCISVATKPNTWPEFVKSTPKKILQMSFCDLDLTNEIVKKELEEFGDGFGYHAGIPYFNTEMAKQILDFYLEARNQVEILLVHCEAGWSRSPGIAAALSKIFTGDDMKWFSKYCPNRFVYRLIMNEAVERGLLC